MAGWLAGWLENLILTKTLNPRVCQFPRLRYYIAMFGKHVPICSRCKFAKTAFVDHKDDLLGPNRLFFRGARKMFLRFAHLE